VVLGSGEVLKARRRELGPDLVPLIVGSEGTLGIVTRVGLRLHPAATARTFAAFAFERVEAGLDALRRLFQEGLRPAVARLYDPLDTLLLADEEGETRPASESAKNPGMRAAAFRAVLRAPVLVARAMALAERSLYSRAALVLVHEGDADGVAREAARAAALCTAGGGRALGEGPARAWYRRRYHVSYRQSALFRGGAFSDTMEVAAPWSRLFEVYEAVRRALGRHVLVMAHFSHSYPDGASVYFTFAGVAHGGASSLEVYDHAWRIALSAALDAGASLSHHHGVGRSKAPRLGEELGSAVGVVRRLKAAWDPDGILNPGALLPPRGRTEAEPAKPVTEPALDAVSALCTLPGAMTLGDAQRWLGARGHGLGLNAESLTQFDSVTVGQWLGLGLPGSADRYADPVGVRLSGFSATLTNGVRIALRTAPRRAVGPDLSALFLGTRDTFGRVDSATLGAPHLHAAPPNALPYLGERSPRLDASETAALEQLRITLAEPSR
jgi:alkyldihydroxyacetonephosphate synthase